MKHFLIFLTSFFSIITILTSCKSGNQKEIGSVRKIKFNEDWKFQIGDNKLASQANFDDTDWKEVKIPHDWSIEGPIEKDNPSGHFGGFYPGGVGYYRKTFQL